MPSLPPLLPGFLVALGIGLLIGIDRERHKGTGPTRQAAGLRTFSLAAIAGATAIAVGGEVLLGAATLGVMGLAALSYWRGRGREPGVPPGAAPGRAALLGGPGLPQPTLAAAG